MFKHKNFKDIYIGPIIKQKVDERHISHAEFARMIHCARTSLYRVFECKSIDIEKLILISEVLDFDFINELYLEQKNTDENLPKITLPIRNGQVDLTDLPAELKDLILKAK